MATAPILPAASSSAVSVSELDPLSLTAAFASFTEAAASLEQSYSQLHREVTRLRHELEETNQDLTVSLQQNQAMRQRLDRILQGLPCGVLVVESDSTLTLANPEACRLLGMAAGMTLPPWARELLCRIRSQEGELEFGKGEARTWITIRCAELRTDAGQSSIFILQEITDLKRLQQEHEILRRRQALADLAAVLAHEIRNPLGSLELFAGLLAESELRAEEQGWVHHLQAGLRRLAATVNNVLQFYSANRPDPAPLDLGPLLRSLEPFLRTLAQGTQVRFELDALDGVLVAGDPHGLEQVLLNLALNAFASMRGSGLLHIAARMETGGEKLKAYVDITDTGPGIAREDQERIFQPGFSTRPGSPGLGLAVCRTIMEQHHGSIRVASQPGSGTTFTLELPLLEASEIGEKL